MTPPHPFPFEHPAHSYNPDLLGGVGWRFKFSNGYSVSVVRHDYSYGRQSSLWELALLDHDGEFFGEEIPDDQIYGWLTEQDVALKLDETCRLPNRVAVS